MTPFQTALDPTTQAPTTLAATALAPMVLPKARALTDALTAPAVTPAVTDGDRRALAESLRAGLSARSGTRPGRQLTVNGYLLRSPGATPSTPFRWSARTARRAIGLPAVRHCREGAPRTPAEAVAGVVDELATEGKRGLGRPGSLGRWLAGQPAGGRAAVRAEATGWCTTVVGAVEWARLPAADVGPTDQWWAVAGTALRARADVRVAVPPAADGTGGDGGGRTALLTVAAGWPGATSRAELGLAALVAAVNGGEVPARVVGWWPECGRSVLADVDRGFLDATAAAVVETVREVRQAG